MALRGRCMVFVFGEVGGEVVAMFVELGGGRGRAGASARASNRPRQTFRLYLFFFFFAERYVGRRRDRDLPQSIISFSSEYLVRRCDPVERLALRVCVWEGCPENSETAELGCHINVGGLRSGEQATEEIHAFSREMSIGRVEEGELVERDRQVDVGGKDTVIGRKWI